MFWRGVIGYLPANLVQAVVGFLTIIIFTRLLTGEQFGHYAIGFTVMALLHTVFFTWNEAALARFCAGEDLKDGGRDHLATAFRTWSALLVVLPCAVALILALPLSTGMRWAAIAGIAAIAPRTLLKLVQERRRALGEVGGAAKLDMAVTSWGLIIGVALASIGAGGAAPLLGAGLAAGLCLAFTWSAEARRVSGGRFEWARARRYLAYGAPVALSLILALIVASTDRLLIAAFLSEETVGVYHAGYSLANRTLDVVFIWLGSASGPALIMALERDGPKGLRDAAGEQASFMLLLTAPAAVGVAMVAQPLADILIGPDLRAGAVQVTPWITLSGFLGGLTTYYFAQAFILAQRTKLLLLAMSVPALANVALNLLLIPLMGLRGALVATVASYGIGLISTIMLGRGALVMPIPWKSLAQVGLASGVMALALSRLPAYGGAAELVLKAAVGAAIYGLIVYTLNAGGARARVGDTLRMLRARAAT